MSFTARGYGGYHDVVGSATESPLGGVEDWSPHQAEQAEHEDGHYSSGSPGKDQQSGSPRSTISSTIEAASTILGVASAILAKLPGARTVSYANAGFIGGCGVAAALVAWLAGVALVMVLLGRWYLPAHEPRHVLPLHFDYSAGRQAQVWTPLLKPSPLAESLSPPAEPYSPAAAGLRGLLTTSSSSPRSSSSSSKTRMSGFGFSPASRFRSSSSASSSSSNGTRDGFWARVSGASRRRRRAAARAAAASAAAVMHDIGNGVFVPEGDWLVPMRGETQLAVELEMPGWPEPDMVQVTGELFSSQGISLGRWTATWLPRPQPLIFRLLNELILGPWRALGLMSSSVRIDLPIFDSYTNPQAPPGGWGALPGYRRFYLRQQLVMQSMDEFGEEGEWSQASRRQGVTQQQQEEEEEDVGHVPGPRALWLRLTLSGRSYESGPPRVYSARAKFDVDRGLLDRLAAALRPSLLTALLVLTVGGALMLGGTGTAAVLLYVAYVVYRWGSRIDSGATVSEEASSYPPRPPGYDVPFSLDEFVEQGEFVEQEPFSTPYDEKGGYEQGGYEQAPLSEEDYEFDTTHRISEEGSDELYQEPDFSAADDLYSSPRSFETERSPFGGHTDSAHRQPFGRISSSSCSSQGDDGRSPSLGYRRVSNEAPAAPAAATAEVPAPPSAAATERLAEAGGVQAAAFGSRLWTVLGLGGSPSPQKQQQGSVGWGYDGVEDLPPSLRSPAPPTATTAAAAATAVAAAAGAAAAVVGGGESAQQGVGLGQDGASSTAAGVSAEGVVKVVEGQVEGEVSWGVEEGEGEGVSEGGGSQQDVGSQQEFQDAAGEIEEAGGSSEGSEDWKRQLMEDSDDDAGTSQQQELHQLHSKGQASKGDPAVPLPVQQLRGQEQQQSAPAAALVDQGGPQEHEAAAAGKKSLLGGLFRSRSGDTTVKRRFGFTFRG